MHPTSTQECESSANKPKRDCALIDSNLKIIDQLIAVLQRLDDDAYTYQDDAHTSSIGMHLRHVVEFYQEFFKASKADGSKILCYDNRVRNMAIEISKTAAAEVLETLKTECTSMNASNINLPMTVTIDPNKPMMEMQTNTDRELFHLLDHAVHHMAIIKMLAQKQNIFFDKGFGLAHSTQAYQNNISKS